MSEPQTRAPKKVSVVVPVYNAGTMIESSVASLLAQSLPAEELELIYVDDGSSDDSLVRLRAAEAEHDHIRVFTIPNSGWPGKPRNVGTDAATGAYVMFVDQDDELAPHALERMYALGSANRADVVLGKVISDFRGVHHYLYRRTLPHCTVHDTWLMGSQTPHKMLRTAFLREHGIRFAEGRRRLEDQLFITEAYLAADSCAIEADYVCYRYLKRVDGSNTGSRRVPPASYYGDLEDVLDVVDRYCPPGPERNLFYRRFLRTEMLGRLGGRRLAAMPPEHRVEQLDVVRELMERRFPVAVDAGLPPLLRIRAALTRADDLAGLVALSDRVRLLKLVPRMSAVTPLPGARLELGVEVEMQFDGRPLQLESEGTDWLLPTELTGNDVPVDLRRIEPLSELLVDGVVRHRGSHDEWFVPGDWECDTPLDQGKGRLQWRGALDLDPARAAGGQRLRNGFHDVHVRIEAFGLNRTRRLSIPPSMLPGPLPMGRGAAVAIAYANRDAKLSLRVRPPAAPLRAALAAALTPVAVGSSLEIAAPVSWLPGSGPITITLLGPSGSIRRSVAGRVHRPASVVGSDPDALAGLGRGTYRVLLGLPGLEPFELAQSFKLDPGLRPDIGRVVRLARQARRGIRRRLP